jgi:hypothetical protein
MPFIYVLPQKTPDLKNIQVFMHYFRNTRTFLYHQNMFMSQRSRLVVILSPKCLTIGRLALFFVSFQCNYFLQYTVYLQHKK